MVFHLMKPTQSIIPVHKIAQLHEGTTHKPNSPKLIVCQVYQLCVLVRGGGIIYSLSAYPSTCAIP